MTVRVYKSTDASAPVLTGQTGSLTDLLQAILVVGYGALTAAGWTRDYYDSASKTACFRPGAGNRHIWQVADNGPGAGTYKEARARGYETMSAYNTGTGPFPTVAQMANGMFIRKSVTADSTARAWTCVADDKTCHLFIDPGDAGAGPIIYTFGDFTSWKASDAYASYITGRTTENSTSYASTVIEHCHTGASTQTLVAGYAPRSYSAAGTSIAISQHTNQSLLKNTSENMFGTTGETYPNPVDGGMLLAPVYLSEGLVKRGVQRGLWAPCHAKPILNYDTFSVTDGATTRDFIAINISAAGQLFVETSNTWDTP